MLPEMGVIFDAGTGMFRVRDLIETETLDIFMSHVHLDHSIGLTFLYDVLYEKNVSKVTVHVARDKVATIRDHLYSQLLFPVEPNYEIRAFDDGPYRLSEDATVTTIPLEHPGGCHGFRLDWPDRALAYVTDTTADEDADYVDLISGVETLIHECYFPDGQEDRAALTGHSCLTPVAKVAAKAQSKRLFLVHINPLDESETPLDLDSIKPIFGNTTIAHDHLVIDV